MAGEHWLVYPVSVPPCVHRSGQGSPTGALLMLGLELGADAGLSLIGLEEMVMAEMALGGGGAPEAVATELAGVDGRSLGSIRHHVRSRGTPLFHAQLLLGCTALNCKRLADHVPETASGIAAAPPAATRDLQTTTSAARGASRTAAPNAAGSALAARPGSWSYIVCLN